jgi:predicted site-specific integrase-resolvase
METAVRMLTPQEAARIVGVEAATFSQWISRGKVRVERYLVNTARRARVSPEEVKRVKKLHEKNLPLPVVARDGEEE